MVSRSSSTSFRTRSTPSTGEIKNSPGCPPGEAGISRDDQELWRAWVTRPSPSPTSPSKPYSPGVGDSWVSACHCPQLQILMGPAKGRLCRRVGN